MNYREHLNDTVSILVGSETQLFQIAKSTKFEPFEFYIGADLRGLDLTGQDLRGLNFANSDLRGSNILDIVYDEGCFNDSILEEDQEDILTDEFDLSCSEFDKLLDRLNWVHFYAVFRQSTLERAVSSFRLTYQDFANRSNVSTTTLLSARRGYPVSKESAKGISQAIIDMSTSEETPAIVDERPVRWQIQPMLKFVEGYEQGKPVSVRKDKIIEEGDRWTEIFGRR